MSFRAHLHRQLSTDRSGRPGLSATNKAVVTAIVLSAVMTILETERALYDQARTVFLASELLFGALFTVEYAARVWSAGEEPRFAGIKGRIRYALTPAAVVDLLAVLPSILLFGTANAFLLRVLRLLRILRLARLGRFTQSLDLMIEALRSRSYELVLSVLIAGILLLFSATLMYLVEARTQPEAFGSIPRALWWSIATLTTVGYGDVYPVTPLGRLLAGFTAVAGVGLIAMPAGIIASAVSDAVQHRKGEED